MTSKITRRAAITSSVRRSEVINILRESPDPGDPPIGYPSQASLTPIPIPDSDTWWGVFDYTKWKQFGADQGVWVTDHWEAEHYLGSIWSVNLIPATSWSTGYRPTKIRISHNAGDPSPLLIVLRFGSTTRVTGTAYLSLDEMDIDPSWYDDGDITRLSIYPGDATFNVTSIEFVSPAYPTESWISRLDDTYWQKYTENGGNWVVDHWESFEATGWENVYIEPINSWNVGYRPVKLRLGLEGNGPLTLYPPAPYVYLMIGDQNQIVTPTSNLQEIILEPSWYDIGDGNINRLFIFLLADTPEFNVVSIEFVV